MTTRRHLRPGLDEYGARSLAAFVTAQPSQQCPDRDLGADRPGELRDVIGPVTTALRRAAIHDQEPAGQIGKRAFEYRAALAPR